MYEAIKDFSLSTVSQLLAFFYSLPVVGGSYGLAIMLLTATVMIVLMPLTVRATRSTIKMTQLQPQLRALQKEYKDDRQKLNQEMMALYSEHGVNPVGGCLPLLAQLPVFLILFNVLRGLTRRVSDKAYFAVADHAHLITGGETTDGRTFDPEYLDQSTELYQDLSGDTSMDFGPFDLARDAWGVVQSDFVGSIPYMVLILFVVGSSYFQQRQVSARRGAVPENPTPQQQTQQQLLRILPLMSGIWSFVFPAGLVLYWATSNVFRIGQQAYITRALYRGDGPGAELLAEQATAGDDAAMAAEGDGGAKDNGAGAPRGKAGAKSGEKASANGSGTSSGLTKAERRARNRERYRASNAARAGSGADGEVHELADEGRPDGGRAKAGSKAGDGGATVDREEAWARRRARRATKTQHKKTQQKKTQQKKTAAEGSSRTTPKGTKPAPSRKKRKR